MNTASLTAPDISCEHCKRTIEQEVGTIPGVKTVSVDIPAKRVDVSYDPGQVTEADIIAKLDDEGYPIAG